MTLALLCAGAIKGLVLAIEPGFSAAAGTAISAQFGAVGAMREALRQGAACDVLVLTEALLVALEASGEVLPASRVPVGRVRTGIAVACGAPMPAIRDAASLRATLLSASALYFPDAERSTAGAHVAHVLRRLGIDEALAPRCRMFANGAIAMRTLADIDDVQAIGCTQITEIRYTPGIVLAGPLPAAFELATTYSAAIARDAREPALARRFIEVLAGEQSRDLRLAGGFDDESHDLS